MRKCFVVELLSIVFLSNRKSVALMPTEIIYVESNDTVTTVYATKGRCFSGSRYCIS